MAERLCDRRMVSRSRSGGYCMLRLGHKGQHSTGLSDSSLRTGRINPDGSTADAEMRPRAVQVNRESKCVDLSGKPHEFHGFGRGADYGLKCTWCGARKVA